MRSICLSSSARLTLSCTDRASRRGLVLSRLIRSRLRIVPPVIALVGRRRHRRDVAEVGRPPAVRSGLAPGLALDRHPAPVDLILGRGAARDRGPDRDPGRGRGRAVGRRRRIVDLVADGTSTAVAHAVKTDAVARHRVIGEGRAPRLRRSCRCASVIASGRPARAATAEGIGTARRTRCASSSPATNSTKTMTTSSRKRPSSWSSIPSCRRPASLSETKARSDLVRSRSTSTRRLRTRLRARDRMRAHSRTCERRRPRSLRNAFRLIPFPRDILTRPCIRPTSKDRLGRLRPSQVPFLLAAMARTRMRISAAVRPSQPRRATDSILTRATPAVCLRRPSRWVTTVPDLRHRDRAGRPRLPQRSYRRALLLRKRRRRPICHRDPVVLCHPVCQLGPRPADLDRAVRRSRSTSTARRCRWTSPGRRR